MKILKKIFLWIIDKYDVEHIYRFNNGAIMVFNNEGRQVPQLQGFVAIGKGRDWPNDMVV